MRPMRPEAHHLRLTFDDDSRFGRTDRGRRCVIDAKHCIHTTRLINWNTGFSIVHKVALQGHVYGCLCCTLVLVSHIHIALHTVLSIDYLPSHQTPNVVKPARALRVAGLRVPRKASKNSEITFDGLNEVERWLKTDIQISTLRCLSLAKRQ